LFSVSKFQVIGTAFTCVCEIMAATGMARLKVCGAVMLPQSSGSSGAIHDSNNNIGFKRTTDFSNSTLSICYG
jgi:hypothetical protein